MTALMPIGLFDLQGKMEDRVRGLLDRRRDPGVRLTTQRRWGMLAAAAIFLAVAASFPLVAPVQAEKLAAAEQASSKPEQQRAIEASQNHTGGLPDPDHKPVAAPEKPAPAQYSRELVEARRMRGRVPRQVEGRGNRKRIQRARWRRRGAGDTCSLAIGRQAGRFTSERSVGEGSHV